MKLSVLGCFAAALITLSSVPAGAHGKPQVSPAKQALTLAKNRAQVARIRTQEGMKLYAAGQWQEAFEKLRAAEELQHSPSRVLHMARCQHKLGKLLEARSLYERLLNEKPASNAPEAVLDDRQAAKKELEIVRVRTPKVRIVLTGVAMETARVLVDGARISSLRNELELNPGTHTIELTALNAEPLVSTFTVSEGRTKTINLVRRPRADKAASAALTTP